MTIEERLESLTKTVEQLSKTGDERTRRFDERLGALAESIELLVMSQRKTDRQIRRLGRFVRTIVIDHEERLLELEGEDDGEEAEEEPPLAP